MSRSRTPLDTPYGSTSSTSSYRQGFRQEYLGKSRGGRGSGPPPFGRGDRGRGHEARPHYGGGAPAPVSTKIGGIQVLTNHYRITHKKPITIYKYAVEILNTLDETRVPNNETKEEILHDYLRGKNISDISLFPYDGDKILITPEKLPRFATGNPTVYRRVPYSVSITLQSEHQIGDDRSDIRAKDETAALVDIILQWAARIKNVKQGRTKFVPINPLKNEIVRLRTRESAEKSAWLGHCQTVQVTRNVTIQFPGTTENTTNPFQKAKETMWSAVLSTAAVVAVEKQPFATFLLKTFDLAVLGSSNPREGVIERINRKIRGLKVETHYIPDSAGVKSKRTYKIEGIATGKTANNHSFTLNNETKETTSTKAYFANRYGIRLNYPNAPLLQIKPAKRELLLPIELVDMSLQKLPWAEDTETKSAMADLMTMEPAARKQYMDNKAKDVFSDNVILQTFSLHVNTQMEKWSATVIAAPTLKYANWTGRPQRGSWNLQNKKFLKPSKIERLVVVDMCNVGIRARETCRHILQEHCSVLGLGSNLTLEYCQAGRDDLPTLRDSLKKTQPTKRLQAAIVLLRQRDTYEYTCVKQAFDGFLPTQCLVYKKTPGICPEKGGNPAGHLGNVLSKLNQKLQGVNHDLDYETTERLTLGKLISTDKSFMIIGMNIIHPATPNVNKFKNTPSVAAVVASLDRNCTVYGHSVRVQERGNSVMDHLQEMLLDILTFRQQIGKQEWPRRIVVFREGISEGQMEDVFVKELFAIERCYVQNGLETPAITCIVIQRNHQVRFFEEAPTDPRQNLGPGTLIHSEGVHPSRFPNFYLISHAGIKGTTRPCRYFILRNDIGVNGKLPLEFWAYFAYQECYVYGRCQKSVSIPAPLYYAKLLAERGKILVAQKIQENLGLDMFAETVSVSSGSERETPLSTQAVASVFEKTNEQLRKLTAAALPMFYC